MEESALIIELRRRGVRSIISGQCDPTLQAMAESHAATMANEGRGGHQGWGTRSQELARELPQFSNFREVAVESYPGRTEQEGADDAVDGWRSSRGHWRSVNGDCSIWAYAMAYSDRTRRWYACGIFAD